MDDDNIDLLALAIESVESELTESFHNVKKVSPVEIQSEKNSNIQQDKKYYSCNNSRSIVGVDLCFEDKEELLSNISPNPLLKKNQDSLLSEKSVVHTGDTDSSDDEDNKYFEERKYDSFGKFIKNSLKSKKTGSVKDFNDSSWKKNLNKSSPIERVGIKEIKSDVSADPVFGIRIINPLVSSQVIKEKMNGRTPVTFAKIKAHVSHGDLNNDWVVAAVVVRKFAPKVSQNGSNYSSWILSDLKSDLKTVSLYLFGKAHQELWKTAAGTVLAILNPSVLNDKKSSEYEAKLSIKSADQIMIWGRSKDLGQCKFMKKSGEVCGSFVNLYQCEYCVYHVKQEYKKYNSRPEFGVQHGNVNLRNKVLGKNEVFYGGKSFSAIPNSVKKKTSVKDVKRLSGLGTTLTPTPEVVCIPNLQRSNEILKMLPSGRSPLTSSKTDKNRLSQLNATNTSSSNKTVPGEYHSKPRLERENTTESEIKTGLNAIPKEIKLPALSNPESDILFNDNSKIKKALCIKSSDSPTNQSTPLVSGKKKSKSYLQQRFNNLVNMKNNTKNDTTSTSPTEGESLLHESPDINLDKTRHTSFINGCSHEGKKYSGKEINAKFANSSLSINNLNNQEESLSENLGVYLTKPKQNDKTDKEVTEEHHNGEPLSKSSSSNDVIKKYQTSNNLNMNSYKRTTLNEMSSPNSNLQISRAKMKALQYVKAKGPINKENPTKTKYDGNTKGIKRPVSSMEDAEDNKKSVLSERFIQLMNQKSLHEDLIEMRQYEQEIEYFEKMEKKDRLEEKMLTTYKINCKAVKCLKCNYLWFSASDACKADGHPIKVVDAVKRFFKCGHCGNRTVSLTIIPLIPCRKCSSSNWVRTAMIKEKIAKNDSLSIRGGEQKFVNSVITNSSLNLLVPDDD